MDSGYKSVTLAPNVYKQYLPGVSLLDMAGFKDSRDHVGVIGVSYFLKSIFDRVRKAKFLIVLTETQIHEETGQAIIKNFSSFIDMFNFKDMKQTHV